MTFIEKIKKEIGRKNYNVYEVAFSMDIVKNGIKFESFTKLEDFMYDQKIDVVFFSKYYDDPSNYIITEDTLRSSIRNSSYNFIDIISNDIDNYNHKIQKIDFDEPFAVIVACLFKGQYCYVYLENDKFYDGNEILEPEEKLYEIIENNKKRIDEKQIENKKTIEELKEEIRKEILNDKNFLLCTTKQLRKNYARTLFKEKLGNKYNPLKDIWTTDAPIGIYPEATDFVEMIWKEMKQS